MTTPTSVNLDAIEAWQARRVELARALRACKPNERKFLRQLPLSGYSYRQAALALGMSTRTAWKFQNRPRVQRAAELFLQDALDRIGVSHTSLVANLTEVMERCMQNRPVLDEKGKPVLVATKNGDLAAAYAFDAKGAVAAVRELKDLLNLAPPKRLELTTKDGKELPTPIFNISFEDGGPGDYGIETSGIPGSEAPGSETVN